jgi:all-trans-retinol 13,14-reductase
VGQKVLVLEQHFVAGGCTHAFEDHGYEFETGIHYIGNVDKRTPLLNLITTDQIQWAKMGGNDPQNMIYDQFFIADKEYTYRSGLDNFRADLKAKFPREAVAIDRYIELVQDAANKELFFEMKIVRPRWLRKLLISILCGGFFKVVAQTTYDVIRSLTSDEELIAVLCAQYGDCGRPPKQTSFFIHASIVNHYFEGGYYPVGGPSVIANKIIPVIEQSGGRVLVSKRVKRILIESRVARGVEMDDGTQIFAKVVISNVGLVNTYTRLLTPEEVAPFPFDSFLSTVGQSKTQIFVFAGLQGTASELGLKSCNTWIWPSQDYDAHERLFEADPLHEKIPMFLACGSAKDPQWAERHGNKSSAMIVAFGVMEWFRKWENQPQGNRDEEYNELKASFRDRMLEEGLFRVYPKCRGKVEFCSVGTPCSVQHFLGYRDGEVYGLNVVPARFQQNITPDTHLEGLYLTGQDVTTVGFTGAMMAGILTAHTVLGYGTVLDILQKRDLVTDLMYAEKLKSMSK